jgi:hypothetical protein
VNYGNLKFATGAPPETFNNYIQSLSTERVTGEYCRKWVLIFPINWKNPANEAWNDAMSKVQGTEALTDVFIDEKIKYFTGFYDSFCTIVSGIPVSFK